MHTFLLCIAAASVGVDAGWQRMPEGGMQYIIQLAPETLQSLREGAEIESDIPPDAGEIRSYKIFVGARRLPRDAPPAPKAAPQSQPEQPAKPWLPLTFALFGLFASLGANVFFGWIAWDYRQRCRAV